MPVKLLSVEGAAARLSARLKRAVPVRTVRWWCDGGYLAGAQKVGRDWVIPEPAVEAFQAPAKGAPKKVAAKG